MSSKPFLVLKIFITTVTVIIAIELVGLMYYNYLLYPWTRDGQVRAQIVQLTSRVTGPIVELPIQDNQFVKKDQLLWKIDPRTFKAKVVHAIAVLQQARVKADEATDVATRARQAYALSTSAVTKQYLVRVINGEREAKAAVLEAIADLKSSKLDLKFTEAYSPVDGYITHLKIHTGTHVVADTPVLALVDTNTFWVVGFFKETLIGDIKIGNKAIVKLMSYPDRPIEGEVESVGWGIAQQNGSTSFDLLPNINPSFDWVRLAQRIPVRIKIKKIPKGINLIVGATATIIIINKKHE